MAKDEESKSREERLSDLRDRLDVLNRRTSSKTRASEDEVRRAVRRPKPPERETPPKQPEKTAPAPEPIIYQRNLPRQSTSPSGATDVGSVSVTLEEAVKGQEVDSSHGKAFAVSMRVDDLDGAEQFSERFGEIISAADSPLCQKLASVCDPRAVAPHDVIFLDIETTGLGNSPLFLIGIMIWERDGFTTYQYLARNYAEEAAVIAFFVESCAPKKLLVTFNGKSFDFPFIRTRAVVNGIPFAVDPAHFDLLHECRRIWRYVLPDCKLQTLERHVCRRVRYGDIPGSQIPEAYHTYVRTENAVQIVEILRHNMLDLITMADIMTRFPKP